MAEWTKAQHWKCCVGATLPWVRIPLSPPFFLPFYLIYSTKLDCLVLILYVKSYVSRRRFSPSVFLSLLFSLLVLLLRLSTGTLRLLTLLAALPLFVSWVNVYVTYGFPVNPNLIYSTFWFRFFFLFYPPFFIYPQNGILSVLLLLTSLSFPSRFDVASTSLDSRSVIASGALQLSSEVCQYSLSVSRFF